MPAAAITMHLAARRDPYLRNACVTNDPTSIMHVPELPLRPWNKCIANYSSRVLFAQEAICYEAGCAIIN